MQVVLRSESQVALFLYPIRASEGDVRLIYDVLSWHRARPAELEGDAERKALCSRTYKKVRVRGKGGPKPLLVVMKSYTVGGFEPVLAEDPKTERLRALSSSGRIWDDLRRWPTDWLASPGVICYERALGQLRRNGQADEDVPTAEQLQGVVHTTELPTAVASSGDHYVVLAPGKTPRFMTVEEVARSFEIL